MNVPKCDYELRNGTATCGRRRVFCLKNVMQCVTSRSFWHPRNLEQYASFDVIRRQATNSMFLTTLSWAAQFFLAVLVRQRPCFTYNTGDKVGWSYILFAFRDRCVVLHLVSNVHFNVLLPICSIFFGAYMCFYLFLILKKVIINVYVSLFLDSWDIFNNRLSAG
ncbi:hypothetical protein DPX39_100044300 [Trypanosoma brucei equiperdum]|uniref:Transmembrane protein n=1 Tax=Trypanosoma brucei equiperdum TaxID=630700 RepID=A0A3L6KYR0_9TRYP|nr:hypothetical protein DPX39_100044300 [Trypanosoma brucei equiperdum]